MLLCASVYDKMKYNTQISFILECYYSQRAFVFTRINLVGARFLFPYNDVIGNMRNKSNMY